MNFHMVKHKQMPSWFVWQERNHFISEIFLSCVRSMLVVVVLVVPVVLIGMVVLECSSVDMRNHMMQMTP